MLDPPQITQTAAQLTAIIRLTIPREEIRKVMGPGIGELRATVAAQGTRRGRSSGECYVAGPESNPDPATFRTELNRPLTS
jgi:hypothetical protein